eukprot:m.1151861 g.1151861  ORF g.1151861 m.1151861 type:complete len:61 (+) comp24481_c0_seq40:3584-3766(+)
MSDAGIVSDDKDHTTRGTVTDQQNANVYRKEHERQDSLLLSTGVCMTQTRLSNSIGTVQR